MLLYEAGEGLRFDEYAAKTGVYGILRVMRELGMVGAKGVPKPRVPPIRSAHSGWSRAPSGGLLRTFRQTGDIVNADEVLGVVSDPFGENETEVIATTHGIIVGRTNLPIVNEGDALFHIATIPDPAGSSAVVGVLSDQLDEESLFDEDEII